MPAEDAVSDLVTALIDEAMQQAQYAAEYVPLPQRRTRPSDGRPVGSKDFDFDEYLTRKADHKAAYPESYSREKAARRREREAMGQRWREQHDIDNCNAVLAESRVSHEHRFGSYNRLLHIWQAIIDAEQVAKIEAIHLSQAARIANVKNRERVEGRVRGIGAAARRAGY